MSERLRTGIGIVLILACLVLLASPALMRRPPQMMRYRSGMIQVEKYEPIKPEVGGSVRVNSADAEELTGLYGVGETLAALIVEERGKNGPFFYPADLTAVRGIGPKTVEKNRKMIDLSLRESGE